MSRIMRNKFKPETRAHFRIVVLKRLFESYIYMTFMLLIY